MATQSMTPAQALEAARTYFPSFLRSREKALKVDSWINGKQYEHSSDLDPDDPFFGQAFAPRAQATNAEYDNLRSLSPNAFGGLIVASLAQTAYLTGIRRPGQDTLPIWNTFERNRWGQRQVAVHRTAIGHGIAYGTVLPGEDPLTGSPMSKMLGKSPLQMAAFYDEDDDEFPHLAIEAKKVRVDPFRNDIGGLTTDGWNVKLYDVGVIHRLRCRGLGGGEDDWEYVDSIPHGMPIVPIARCVNRIDLEGRTTGEIEPVLPILRRIDQDLFDRLIQQRFGAWQVRYISGMAKPASGDAQAEKLRLSVEDILVSSNPDTKFGVLPAGSTSDAVSVTDADLRLLSAITQMPPHHLLGVSSNLQAEALAAAEQGLQRKAFDFRTNASEFHEQMARLAAIAEGDLVTAAAFDLQTAWRDTESRSFAQTAQALGVLATQLKVPLEMLWEQIPNWTDTDVERARQLVENGSIEELLNQLIPTTDQGQQQGQPGQQDQGQQQGGQGGNPVTGAA